ncbi:menaquinone biosynthetic enzyme MqnA/MqnD family protein [Geoalkalibacter halelectricus]|uniref:menaquinone biosynthetic enzyme MqnA/MqnD family protein n=1 Tax=Geoalkalibacter halelectricus TaxID=2847045 RepID=UPI003D20DF0B
MSLAVGQITYLNCAPFFHHLARCGFRGQLIGGVPSALNRMLHEGSIDVCPSSSFEYAAHWQDYLLLPRLSISAQGPVRSVLLFSPHPIEQLDGHEIALTGESATSVNLLRILLWEFLGIENARFKVSETSVEDQIAKGRPALLIGDRALRGARRFRDLCRIYDLGDLWYQHTGLPFVFALWILRRQAAQAKRAELIALTNQLERSLRAAFSSLEEMALTVPENAWYDPADICAYWRCMSYGLDDSHQRGLELFFRLCYKHGLIESLPALEFFSCRAERENKGVVFA